MNRHRLGAVLLLAAVVVFLAAHCIILIFAASQVGMSGAVAVGLIVLIIGKHVGWLGPLYALLRRLSSHS